MILGKVVDTVVSTRKVDSLVGYKIMIVNCLDRDQKETGEHVVAIDHIGAGIGETVIVCEGDNARFACDRKEIPTDAVIVGIVD